MGQKSKRLYEFGRFHLDPEEEVLFSDSKPVHLKPKTFEMLLVLVENRGRILDREFLMNRLWQDTFVEEANLNIHISHLRKALGQTEGDDPFIETLPRRGYRFNADVREVWVEEPVLIVKEFKSSRTTIEETEGREDEISDSDDRLSPGAAPATARTLDTAVNRPSSKRHPIGEWR